MIPGNALPRANDLTLSRRECDNCRGFQMHSDPTFERSFRRLYGKPCWNARRGHGSFLTLEFGTPRLEIREPRKASPGSSRIVRKNFARRLVTLRGDWHLWIYCADWTVYDTRKRVADSDASKTKIDEAAGLLDGQALTEATFQYRGCRSVFSFDLGGRLVVTPYEPSDEAWMLFEPDRKVLALKGDKTFNHRSKDTPRDCEVWRCAWLP